MKILFERIIYAISLLLAILSMFYSWSILGYLLPLAAIFYLTLGWYFLNPEETKKFHFIYFLSAYSFSAAFIAYHFSFKVMPLANSLTIGSIVFLLLSLVLLITSKKQSPELLVKILLLSGLSVLQLLM